MSSDVSTLLGFDFGTHRIGVAIGQLMTRTARPLTTLKARDGQPDWDELGKLLAEWRPSALVVGLPVHMDGTEHERTRMARRFGNRLQGRFNLPIYWVDERLSSEEAQRRQQNGSANKQHSLDALAAEIILQTWLDQQ